MRLNYKNTAVPDNAFVFDPGIIQLAEFDIGGVLYHANYFRLFERAREALLEHIGYPYSRLVQDKCHLAIFESKLEFLRPIHYGDKVTIKLWPAELRRSLLRFHYIIHSDKAGETPAHLAYTLHALVESKPDGFRTTKLPTELEKMLQELISSPK